MEQSSYSFDLIATILLQDSGLFHNISITVNEFSTIVQSRGKEKNDSA